MLRMTYGKLPTRDDFRATFDAACPDGYRINLNASDAFTFYAVCDGKRFGDTPGEWSADQTWFAVVALADAWNADGNEKAGALASDILTTLGIEWI